MEVHENPLAELEPEDLKGLLGTYVTPGISEVEGFKFKELPENPNYEAPASFDARSKWGSKIHAIRD